MYFFYVVKYLLRKTCFRFYLSTFLSCLILVSIGVWLWWGRKPFLPFPWDPNTSRGSGSLRSSHGRESSVGPPLSRWPPGVYDLQWHLLSHSCPEVHRRPHSRNTFLPSRQKWDRNDQVETAFYLQKHHGFLDFLIDRELKVILSVNSWRVTVSRFREEERPLKVSITIIMVGHHPFVVPSKNHKKSGQSLFASLQARPR